ncbi:glycosyltransferase [bacterium]|nr:glycosyltransferase [bacterium]
MKICDIVQFYSPIGGGVKRYLNDKIDYISDKTDFEHFVVVPSNQSKIETYKQSKFYHVKSMPLIGSISYRMLLNRKRILSVIYKEKPEMIEVGDPYRSAWICLEASKRYNIPIVAFYHSDFPRAMGRTIHRFCGEWIDKQLSKAVNRYILNLYNQMDATVVASRRMKQILEDCGFKNTVRIPLGTNVDIFRPNDAGAQEVRKKLGLSAEDTLLLFVGRLAREKNIRSLIRMMDVLAHPPFGSQRYHLLLVGDGELRRYVQFSIHSKKNITWHRYCESTEELTGYYTAADLLIHAGEYETFGITSVEAQACGTKVLAIRDGGMDDTVMGEDPLIMAESHEPEHLADCVIQTQTQPRGTSAEERRNRIVKNFSSQLLFTRLFQLYEHILEGNPSHEFRIREDEEVRTQAHVEDSAIYS